MESKPDYFEDIKTIKKIMEESSRFLSLSGLSGLFAGSFALFGGAAAYLAGFVAINLFVIALIVLILAICSALFFSYKKAQQLGQRFWTPISKRLLLNFLIPLVTGGAFILILCLNSQWQLIVPSMLIFYGLALVNAGKFTYSEVFYLGLAEIITGLISAFIPEYAIISWCFGFGVLHIVYGLIMYRKYEA